MALSDGGGDAHGEDKSINLQELWKDYYGKITDTYTSGNSFSVSILPDFLSIYGVNTLVKTFQEVVFFTQPKITI